MMEPTTQMPVSYVSASGIENPNGSEMTSVLAEENVLDAQATGGEGERLDSSMLTSDGTDVDGTPPPTPPPKPCHAEQNSPPTEAPTTTSGREPAAAYETWVSPRRYSGFDVEPPDAVDTSTDGPHVLSNAVSTSEARYDTSSGGGGGGGSDGGDGSDGSPLVMTTEASTHTPDVLALGSDGPRMDGRQFDSLPRKGKRNSLRDMM
jgi:hypothetical protein